LPSKKIMPSFKVQDSIAFVTGTNKPNGIGQAIVEALVANGASKVYATARRVSELDDLVAKHKGVVIPVQLDVTDLHAITALSKTYPDVTIVVNNAGYAGEQPALGELNKINVEMLVNYLAPLAIVKAFSTVFPTESTHENGVKPTAIVNINSIVSFVNFPSLASYSASKAAAHSLTQAQRRELPNSLVIGVYPGPIDTDMAKGIDMEKTSPSDVASEIMNALSGGDEYLFPDPFSKQTFDAWKTDFMAVEQQMVEMAASM
jgi:NAD(P)-dependent dehydrogenase (short-subunit alcohol dehydrogenase family)